MKIKIMNFILNTFVFFVNFSSNLADGTSRPTKRSKKSSSNDNISELNNEQISSQSEMNE